MCKIKPRGATRSQSHTSRIKFTYCLVRCKNVKNYNVGIGIF